jgi:hypothetical protein
MELLLIPLARVVLDAFVLVFFFAQMFSFMLVPTGVLGLRCLVDEPWMDMNILCKFDG